MSCCLMMKLLRNVERILSAYATVEGAGVRLHRAFGYYEVPQFDPFLMLDDFRAQRPEDYLAGFPYHPHRGIETVTYMLEGALDHEDSVGHKGRLTGGDVQWMTAGSGVIHQEMPGPVEGKMGGFQLWINLPRAQKMTKPRYQHIRSAKIPTVSPQPGSTVRVISGTVDGVTGPVKKVVSDPLFLDVTLEPGASFSHGITAAHTAFAYVISGEGAFDPGAEYRVHNRDLVLFSHGTTVQARASGKGMRFLLIAGRPLGEPVAWRGSVVMNTREELRQASADEKAGTFIKTAR